MNHAAIHGRIEKWLLQKQLVPLEALVDEVAGMAADAPLTDAGLAALTPTLDAELGRSAVSVGIGFVAAPGKVRGRSLYLHWMQLSGSRSVPLKLNLDRRDADVYDYLEMDWYVHARDRRRPVIQGPYLDYSGSDRFVFTLTVPVVVDDEFLGVVGADLLADRVEASLCGILRSHTGRALVVGGDGTVIASNTPDWMPGETLRTHPRDAPATFEAVELISEWSGWSLATIETAS
ncbi:cache domain-containing protein [Gordonia sp. KTR9]|uniref:cache domain-containing protein n=1 Tax=Gordonia sp. KTR9 TaxID=337191 RepID=UPI0002DBC8E4|nr:cache domain-containing protein [Gordonia sp. KTR9]